MNIDDHDHEISFVILESQTEVQWIVAMTVFIVHLFMPPAIYGLFQPCSVNRMAIKLEANIRNYAGEEWISSFREMWRCVTHGTFFSGLRIVNKMKQIS